MNKFDQRLKDILKAIIQSHIDLNIPVGSILITKRFPMGLSSATIRGTMAKLEEMGYITQPHTSAGRVPTERGYRFYINVLMEEHKLSVNTNRTQALSNRLSVIKEDSASLVKEAARTLSAFSRYLAIATPLKIDDTLLRRIKFIKYEGRRVLAVVISDEGIIKNSIINLDKTYSQKQLDLAADYMNSRFSGLPIKKVREKIAYQIYKEKKVCDQLIGNLLHVCRDIVPSGNDDFSLNGLAGTANLPDFANTKQIKVILKAIEDKRFVLKLLQKLKDSQGTQVFVGMENILPSMGELSMVVSTYKNNKLASGAVGIIGPTRMNYEKMIPIVDHTARALTEILSES